MLPTPPAGGRGGPRSTRDDEARRLRYTLMVVPEGGHGSVWQRSVRLAAVRRAAVIAGGVIALLVVATLVLAVSFPRVLEHDRLVTENLALRTRLQSMERKVAELEPVIQRVRVYDEQLRDAANRQALPGFGPLEPDEEAAREAWLAGEPQPGVDDGPLTAVAPDDVEEALAIAWARLAGVEDDLQFLDGRLDDARDLLARWESAQSVLPHLWPVDGAVLTSPFGWRKSPYGPGWKFHTGLDLGVPYGTPVVATAPGLVTFSGWDGGHGNTVDVDHGQGVATRYCHASSLLVSAGDQVEAGDLLALAGSTGVSTGPHLHFELFFDGEKVDPLPYLP